MSLKYSKNKSVFLVVSGLLAGSVFSLNLSALFLPIILIPYIFSFISDEKIKLKQALSDNLAFFGPFFQNKLISTLFRLSW